MVVLPHELSCIFLILVHNFHSFVLVFLGLVYYTTKASLLCLDALQSTVVA